MKKKIIILLGSIKSDSVNLKIVEYFTQKTQSFFEVEAYPLSNLPYFNPDLEDDLLPKTVVDFRQKIEAADGVFICTPEYVFSIPGILKNALEWLVSTIIFDLKPTAIITASSSGEAAHASIQLIIKTIGGDFDEKTAVLIAAPKSKISKTGEITDPKTAQLIEDLIQNFKEKIP
jgi:chromate reductase, NAD(P)H dehydrogenase (quinone)